MQLVPPLHCIAAVLPPGYHQGYQLLISNAAGQHDSDSISNVAGERMTLPVPAYGPEQVIISASNGIRPLDGTLDFFANSLPTSWQSQYAALA